MIRKVLLNINTQYNHDNKKAWVILGENLHVCGYERCGRSYALPVRLTDLSNKPKLETYYACPYCFSKVDETETEDMGDVDNELKVMPNAELQSPNKDGSKKSAKNWEQKESTKSAPAVNCPHHVGYLKTRSKDEAVPDGCLVCPKILQCMV
jgi:DNA-directed RNA polymerase subunit RPC12/RpoP